LSHGSNWHKPGSPRAVEEPASSRPELSEEWSTGRPVNQSTRQKESRFRSRVERKMKGVRYPVQELEKWVLWCKINNIDFQDFATEACRQLYEAICGRPVNQSTTINDFEDLKTKDDEASSSNLLPNVGRPVDQAEKKLQQMLAFYREKTGNQIKQRDRDAYLKGNTDCSGVAELPEDAIKCGIMQSVLLCKGRVYSFSYCLGAIWEAHESGMSADMVEYLQRTYTVRLEQRANPDKSLSSYFSQLAAASQGQQPALPATSGELKEFAKPEKPRLNFSLVVSAIECAMTFNKITLEVAIEQLKDPNQPHPLLVEATEQEIQSVVDYFVNERQYQDDKRGESK
jgi:hypothetical protein